MKINGNIMHNEAVDFDQIFYNEKIFWTANKISWILLLLFLYRQHQGAWIAPWSTKSIISTLE